MSSSLLLLVHGDQVGPFTIISFLGKGASGQVYKCKNSQGQTFALKITEPHVKVRLLKEYKLCQLLYNGDKFSQMTALNKFCVPRVYYYAQTTIKDTSADQKPICIMVMDLLGASLENFLEQQPKTFSHKQLSDLGIKLIELLEQLHVSLQHVSGDIKPANILSTTAMNSKTKPNNFESPQLIDFGLSRSISKDIVIQSEEDVPRHEHGHFVGTLRFCSINNHDCKLTSPRDDIESLVYVLLYCKYGKLPWQHTNTMTAGSIQRRRDEVAALKMSTPELFANTSNDNSSLIKIWNHVRSLHFGEYPDYTMVKGLLLLNPVVV